MPQFVCMLYAPAEDAEDRSADMPRWFEITDRLREAGILVTNSPLRSVETATTVRVRDARVHLTDGPFATTKEVLAGVYVLECPDLDVALRHAAMFPLAEYGSVEVRPVGLDGS